MINGLVVIDDPRCLLTLLIHDRPHNLERPFLCRWEVEPRLESGGRVSPEPEPPVQGQEIEIDWRLRRNAGLEARSLEGDT